MNSLCFRSDDERFGLTVKGLPLERMLALCVQAGAIETGGVLIGRYAVTHDCALVTAASGPPAGSRQGRTRFYRGVGGVRQKLARSWRDHRWYYLGEWHFHPQGSTSPSQVDVRQMEAIATNPSWCCPEPVLLIIGGDPAGAWSAGAYVFPAGRQRVDLTIQTDRPQCTVSSSCITE